MRKLARKRKPVLKEQILLTNQYNYKYITTGSPYSLT